MSQEPPQQPRPHPAPAYTHSAHSRHHPYAPPAHRHAAPHAAPQQNGHRVSPPRGPPSPARSRGPEESPPLANKFDHGDNYWEDVPAAPASLKMILDSFRRSGEGDRDLLLSILGAKKSEEERLTAIIQTRLTLLQARLNISAIQAQATLAMPMQPAAPLSPRSPDGARPARESFEMPQYMHPRERYDERERERELREREMRDREARVEPRDPHPRDPRERIHLAPLYDREYAERLPPLERYPVSPRGSRSGSASSGERAERAERSERERAEPRDREREPIRERELPPLREREREPRDARDAREPREPRDARDRGEPRADRRAGLDMLLEGVREAERESS